MAQEEQERRKYIRLSSCFPVEFSLCYVAQRPVSEEYQGFTSNVSRGGLCISVRTLKEQSLQLILQRKVMLKVSINLPLSLKPVAATGEIMWSKRDESDPTGRTCLIGLSYCDIKPQDRDRIANYALRLKWTPRIAALLLVMLLLNLAILSFYHIKAKAENERLVKELVSILEVKTDVERRLNEVKIAKGLLESKFTTGKAQIERLRGEISGIETKTGSAKERLADELDKTLAEQKDLRDRLAKLSTESVIVQDMARKTTEAKLTELRDKINALQMEMTEVTRKGGSQVELLQEELSKLQQENESLKEQIDLRGRGEVSLEEQLSQIKAKSSGLQEVNINKMLEWLKIHQTRKTGLVLSYEGDKSLEDWGFTYDESLACQAFLLSGDAKRAKAILDFYAERAKACDGLFYNVYDVKTGAPCEYAIHSGPNIWIGLSACRYTKRTNDKKFLSLAEKIADKMLKMQRASSDKSIKGGPQVEWVSTEHNLDAYALFNMLYGITKDTKYKDGACATLGWLKEVGYNRPEGAFMRGRGDATIATDTFSWAIASIGPEVLAANGMDPDDVMEFAENECKVTADFYRPDNTATKVTGFDFAKAQHLGRGGVVSTEWTGQMVVAFKIMADYYKGLGDKEKERIYRSKAEYYLSQLGKMVISSPSPTGQGEGCLPYASVDNVDTGHGWRVAKGRRTGSVAATAYYIFAHKGYNPLT